MQSYPNLQADKFASYVERIEHTPQSLSSMCNNNRILIDSRRQNPVYKTLCPEFRQNNEIVVLCGHIETASKIFANSSIS